MACHRPPNSGTISDATRHCQRYGVSDWSPDFAPSPQALQGEPLPLGHLFSPRASARGTQRPACGRQAEAAGLNLALKGHSRLRALTLVGKRHAFRHPPKQHAFSHYSDSLRAMRPYQRNWNRGNYRKVCARPCPTRRRKSSASMCTTLHISYRRERMRSPMRSARVSSRMAPRRVGVSR